MRSKKKSLLSKSEQMARVRSRNTGLELMLRRVLWRSGLRYRLNLKLPGTPDVVFANDKLAVFIDGCFWHACPTHYRAPATNVAFWRDKYDRNSKRDQHVNECLRSDGWTVLRIWEHEIIQDIDKAVARIVSSLGFAANQQAKMERDTITAIRRAVREKRLEEPFTPHEVNTLLKSTWAGVFLPKHRLGNPGGFSELFVRVRRGVYRLKC
jgi:DNA mismatch endonuclease (patch repair protein)